MTARWRDLPHSTREEVRRCAANGHPHPDPTVRQAAADWGARVRRIQLSLMPLLPVGMILNFSRDLLPESDSMLTDFAFGLAPILISLAFFVGFGLWLALSTRHAERVERVNLEALLNAAHLPSDEPFVAHRRLFVPGFDVAAVGWIAFAAVFSLGLLHGIDDMLADGAPGVLTAAGPFLRASATAFGVAIGATWFGLAAVTPRGRGALLTMDPAGVTIPHLGLTFGWDEVERVDFGHGMSLDFRLRDADAVVRRRRRDRGGVGRRASTRACCPSRPFSCGSRSARSWRRLGRCTRLRTRARPAVPRPTLIMRFRGSPDCTPGGSRKHSPAPPNSTLSS